VFLWSPDFPLLLLM